MTTIPEDWPQIGQPFRDLNDRTWQVSFYTPDMAHALCSDPHGIYIFSTEEWLQECVCPTFILNLDEDQRPPGVQEYMHRRDIRYREGREHGRELGREEVARTIQEITGVDKIVNAILQARSY